MVGRKISGSCSCIDCIIGKKGIRFVKWGQRPFQDFPDEFVQRKSSGGRGFFGLYFEIIRNFECCYQGTDLQDRGTSTFIVAQLVRPYKYRKKRDLVKAHRYRQFDESLTLMKDTTSEVTFSPKAFGYRRCPLGNWCNGGVKKTRVCLTR